MLKHASVLHGVTGVHGPASIPWITILAEGLGMRAVARVFKADPTMVLAWLLDAAEYDTAFFWYSRESAGCGDTAHHTNCRIGRFQDDGCEPVAVWLVRRRVAAR